MRVVRTVQPEHVIDVLEVRSVEMTFPPMTDEEAADWLRSMPREPAQPVPESVSWTGNETVHHAYGESRDQL